MARVSTQLSTAERRLRRYRRLRWAIAGAAVLLVLLVALDHLGTFGYGGDDWGDFDNRPVTVVRVIDGRTLQIRAGGREATLGLLGVTDPAPEAAEALRQWTGETVALRLDGTQTRDAAGHLRGYLFDANHQNLNLRLIELGHARADRQEDYVCRQQFLRAEQEAHHRQRGRWQLAPPASSSGD